MMKALSLPLCLLTLAACDALDGNARRAGDDLKRNYDHSRSVLADWIYRREEPAPYPYEPEPRFCYRVQTDVLCYDRPEPGLNTVMVGAQGTGGWRSYAAETPTAAVEEETPSPETESIAVTALPPPAMDAPFHAAPSPSAVDAKKVEPQPTASSSAPTSQVAGASGAPIDLMASH